MIRKVEKSEIAACVEIIRKSFHTVAEEFGFTEENAPRFTAFSTTVERLNRQFEDGRPMFVWIDETGRVTGYYSLLLLEDGTCELNNLCVLPQFRHLGIGKALFLHAEETARRFHCHLMRIAIVEENVVLRSWYEKLGARHRETKKFDFFPFTCGYLDLAL